MSVNDPQNEAGGSLAITGPKPVPAGHGWQWIAEGFGFFKQNPWAWIGAFIVWFIMMLALSIIPIIGAIASILLTYVFIGGFMIGCREQADGGDFTVGHLFSGFSNQFGNLVLLSFLYLVSFIILAAIVGGWMFATGMLSANEQELAADPGAVLLPALVGLALWIPIVMLFWFAPALIVNNNVPVFQAMSLSFKGCLKNIIPFLVYGILALLLYFVAVIPLLLGLLVLIPTLLASIFAAYRDIYTG